MQNLTSTCNRSIYSFGKFLPSKESHHSCTHYALVNMFYCSSCPNNFTTWSSLCICLPLLWHAPQAQYASGLLYWEQASARKRQFLYPNTHTRYWGVLINITLVEFTSIANGCKSRSRHRRTEKWLLTLVLFRVFVQVFESQIPSRLYSVSLNKQLFSQEIGPVCRLRLIQRPCAEQSQSSLGRR